MFVCVFIPFIVFFVLLVCDLHLHLFYLFFFSVEFFSRKAVYKKVIRILEAQMNIQRILVLNAGSSSLKYALFKAADNQIERVTASGIIEAIGQKTQTIKHKYCEEKDGSDEVTTIKLSEKLNHKGAMTKCLSLLSETTSIHGNSLAIDAVGHRVVHGGEKLSSPRIVDAHTLTSIREASVLAPLHNPANLLGIETSMKLLSESVKHVAVFDTAFHSTIPRHAFLYALPYECYAQHGVRKYGFHGTSHEYILKETSRFLRKPKDSLNMIACHIGAGASVCCIKNGESVDTSMGFTPLEGLVMATRCGDLDPSVIFYLMKQMNLTAVEVEDLLLNQSGWYGLAGTKHARDIESAAGSNEMAALTTDVIAHRIRKYIGAYFWSLGGVCDAIVFTAGLGENWPELRRLCLHECENFGIEMDLEKNEEIVGKRAVTDISTCESKVKVLVVPTDEEGSIAQKTLELISS